MTATVTVKTKWTPSDEGQIHDDCALLFHVPILLQDAFALAPVLVDFDA